MKYLGIDFGSKRLGIAVSDDTGVMAFPHSVISNDNKTLEKLENLIKKERIEKIVMGESTDFSGVPNEIMNGILRFKGDLKEKTKLDIFFEPEFLTSKEALHLQGETPMHDASAAAIILQSYLNRLH